MNRKLLQDQPLKLDYDDLESVNYLEKQDKKRQDSDVKRPDSASKRSDSASKRGESGVKQQLITSFEQINPRQKLMAHNLHVLDEDIENFKIKIEDLVNKFKNDTINEFITMKRAVLKDQQDAIESETQKYTRILESRNNELDTIKIGLAKKIKQQERSEAIIDVLSERYGESKRKLQNAAMLAKCFSQFKLYRDYKQMKKKMSSVAEKWNEKMQVRKLFGAWKSHHVSNLEKIIKASLDDQHNKDISNMASKFNKEIEHLTIKLKETTEQLETATRAKIEMQDNLKRAFMRGVSAMNFEAMTLLQGDVQPKQLSNQGSGEKTALKETSKLSQKIFDEIEFNKENLSNSLIISSANEKRKLSFSHQGSPGYLAQPQNTSFDSKETRWKEPPTVGAFSVLKAELNQQQPIRVRDVIQRSPTPPRKGRMEPENTSMYQEVQETEDEGKVIRVTAGKSYASNKENLYVMPTQSFAGKKTTKPAGGLMATNVPKKR